MAKSTDKILNRLIDRYGKQWEAQAKKAMARLEEEIAAGVSITKAVANVRKEYGALFRLDGLQDMMTEAACYGYGIMPTVLTSKQNAAWGAALATAWDASGMTLSEKIHGAGVKMRGEIIRTLQTQARNNQSWMKAARALYDGYANGKNDFTGGKDIIRPQEIPKYIRKVLIATNDSKKAVAQRQALDKINRLAKSGAPDKALQAAYNELIDSVKAGNDEAIQKAIKTAINEKSRYVAERITRTEMARAYADGFIAKMNGDDDIVAVKFKLSGRHPTFDICDMYAKADMYNLGAGVYPKDKLPPLPIHPHCLCRYVEIYTGEVDTGKQRERVREAGDKWLNGLNEYQRQKVLGIDGVKAWKGGKDWRDFAYGYTKHTKGTTRLKTAVKELKGTKAPEKPKMPEASKTQNATDYMGKAERYKDDELLVKGYALDGHKGFSIQRNTKNTLKTVELIEKAKEKIPMLGELDQIIVRVNMNKIAGYVSATNRLYVNEKLSDTAYIKAMLEKKYFAATGAEDILRHEMNHKKHRDYIKKIVETSGGDYATIKQDIETPLREYVKKQRAMDVTCLSKVVSDYANNDYQKKGVINRQDQLNEVIAEVLILAENGIVRDETLLKHVRRCIGDDAGENTNT